MTPGIPELTFYFFVNLNYFNGVLSVLEYCINYQYFTLRGPIGGIHVPPKLIILTDFRSWGVVGLRSLIHFDQLPVFYPKGHPLRHPGPWKPNMYMLNFNNFSTTSPVLDRKVSLNRVYQDIWYPLGVPPKTLEPIFLNLRQISCFLMMFILLWDT